MGKADKESTKQTIGDQTQRAQANSTAGEDQTQARVNALAPTSDAMRQDIWNVNQQKAVNPDYNNVYGNLSAANGGVANLGDINNIAGGLADTSGNYGDVNTSINTLNTAGSRYGDTNKSIGGLQDFAKTGGVSAANVGKIDNPTLNEFAATGGYSDADKANIRARSNNSIASTYGNLQNNLNRNRIVANNVGPGWDASSRSMGRAAAQQIGQQTQATEAGIKDAVNANRLSAAGTLSGNMLGLSGLQSSNTLSGYGTSGNLANTRESQIASAAAQAASAGLERQRQIDAAKEASAGIGMNSSALVNQSRLSAANGANSTALAGNQGMQGVYSSAPGALTQEENLLLNYRNADANAQNNLIESRIGQGSMPGLGSDISQGIGDVAMLSGAAAPFFGNGVKR